MRLTEGGAAGVFVLCLATGACAMGGALGPYPMTREASGTSWQPESTPHEGLHLREGGWRLMVHGYADGIYDRQGGARGDSKAFSSSMLMARAQRAWGPGTFALHSMLSLDPAMGAAGYPLLLQTGETADGRTPLVDRQHPHDLFMELAASYSLPLGEESSVFVYAGLPGEPALGPAAFMHRASGMDLPEAPITHHWLDSTHVTFGAATLGWVSGRWKLEGSAFKGREPDEHRWDLESPKLDSYSARLSFNPDADWALQASAGRIKSPEQLQPGADVDRFTASASRNFALGGRRGQWTFAFGRNWDSPGNRLNAFLLESELKSSEEWTLMARAEYVDKDELSEAGTVYGAGKLSFGGVRDAAAWGRTKWGLGALASVYALPAGLRASYGRFPLSLMLFARVKLV